jgi:hypothetical protein
MYVKRTWGFAAEVEVGDDDMLPSTTTSAKHAQHNGLAAEQILLRCVRHPSPTNPRSTTIISSTTRSMQIPVPSCHVAQSRSSHMKPTTSPQCALAVSTTVPSRAAEVRLCKRVACSLQLAVLRQVVRAGLLEQGRRANAVAWMGGGMHHCFRW